LIILSFKFSITLDFAYAGDKLYIAKLL
jgi:hypothetical protein